MPVVSPQDPWHQASVILELIRSGRAQTRPELVDATGLGRNVINPRLQLIADLGLAGPSGTGPSRGGRAADRWVFNGGAGHLLIGTIGATRLRVALTDLGNRIIATREIGWDRPHEPDTTAERIAADMDDLLATAGVERVWGVSIGTPAPVDVITGRTIDPIESPGSAPRMPVDFDMRHWFTQRFHAPTWTESVANLGALGVAASTQAPDDFIFVRLGTGLGAGIVSGGRIVRGAHSLAGLLAHLTLREDPERRCFCGRTGCVDAYACGWALIADAERAVAEGRTTTLAALAASRPLTLEDIAEGARQGDPLSVELVVQSADAVGRGLGVLVTAVDPADIILGGSSMVRDTLFQTVLTRSIRATSLAAASAQVRVTLGDPEEREALVGAADLAASALFSPGYLAEWGPHGSPVGVSGLLSRPEQT